MQQQLLIPHLVTKNQRKKSYLLHPLSLQILHAKGVAIRAATLFLRHHALFYEPKNNHKAGAITREIRQRIDWAYEVQQTVKNKGWKGDNGSKELQRQIRGANWEWARKAAKKIIEYDGDTSSINSAEPIKPIETKKAEIKKIEKKPIEVKKEEIKSIPRSEVMGKTYARILRSSSTFTKNDLSYQSNMDFMGVGGENNITESNTCAENMINFLIGIGTLKKIGDIYYTGEAV